MLYFISLLLLVVQFSSIQSGCPVTDNPSQMFQCLTINPQAFIDLISKGDYKSFCHMANGYMTCMTTYLRDCLGGKAATGILEELQDLNLKCCITGKTQECVVKNPSLLGKCFAADNFITLVNGEKKNIIDAQIGDKVKAVDSNGNVVDTEIVGILHKSFNSTTMFQTLYDQNENKISLTGSHLVHVENKGYIKASSVKVGDKLRIYSFDEKMFKEFKIKRIQFELKTGFIAPLTNHGTLLVNQIDSSCYAEVNNHKLADLSMIPYKMWYKMSKYLCNKQETKVDDNVQINAYFKYLHQFVVTFLPSFLN